MSFTQATFAPVSSHSSNTPNVYSYKTNDTLFQVQAAGYFSEKSAQIEEGDFFLVFATDGSNFFRSIGGKLFPFVSVGQQVIVEVDDAYQILVSDDIINSNGNNTITMVPASEARKQITLTSNSGTITLAADVTIEEPSTITTGASETFYLARGQWNHK